MSARRLNLWDSMWGQVVRAACGRSGVIGRRFVSTGLRVRQTPTLCMTRSKNTWTRARTWGDAIAITPRAPDRPLSDRPSAVPIAARDLVAAHEAGECVLETVLTGQKRPPGTNTHSGRSIAQGTRTIFSATRRTAYTQTGSASPPHCVVPPLF